jgi:hypothetical protein
MMYFPDCGVCGDETFGVRNGRPFETAGSYQVHILGQGADYVGIK